MNRLAKVRNFCGESASLDLKSSLDNVADHLSRGPLSGTFALVVIEGDRRRVLIADLNRSEFEEIQEVNADVEAPDFVVYVQHDALMGILRGEISPITALFRGRLRFSGNEKLGLAIFRELASTHDAIFRPCSEPKER